MSFIFKWKKRSDWLRLQQQDEPLEERDPSTQGDASARRFKCRVCGLEASDDSFCPDCLALTMEPIDSSPASPE